ncbi:ribosome biogenesis protein SPATA5-like isoform X1 [Diorhabda sublineata]|uniref:ribosome biogenesis protein SPATA5-like isoform X1 n=1 Tax=Diorhabda sublineata TaxID=1163346 RepID=UPI0024E06225|nr:ribosome biogenesis protein SPATA5-like isoform X1 [Diorhabda sublineata]
MSQQKLKKSTFWMQCDHCSIFLNTKDSDQHNNDCPPDIKVGAYNFVKNEILYGTLDQKVNEEIKNISSKDKENLVFLSESVIRLCSLAIGDYAVISCLNNKTPPVAKIVWPTMEKSLTSVLFTKNALDIGSLKINERVAVKRLPIPVSEATSISLLIINRPKSLDITPELYNRLSKTYENKIITKGNFISVMFYGKELKFEVKTLESSNDRDDSDLTNYFSELCIGDQQPFYKVTSKTKWTCFKDEESFQKEFENKVFERPAGVEEEINEIVDLINSCFENSVNKSRTKAVLLYGHSGTGKTMISQYISSKFNANIVNIGSPDLCSTKSSSIEKYIKQLFAEAADNSPSIIILDEFDIICPTRGTRLTETEKRIVSTFLKIFDELHNRQLLKIFVLATSNKPDNIDPAFRRCGRLDREIEIPTPSPRSRRAILQTLLTQMNIRIDENNLQHVAMNTHGYVGSDLVALCSMAALNGNRNKRLVKIEDFEYALKRVRPSAMREVQIEISNVKWSDIGGQEKLKMILKQAIEWPLKHPQSFLRLGVTPPKGVLMFGPPGCSKTMIAKALACESGLNFLSIKGPELFNKWVGESERAVREVFRKARQVAPSIIFFDEIDALGGERGGSTSGTNVQERVLAQLLTELDGITPLQDVTVLAATNRPDRIDKALLRPGRLDRIVYVPLPDEQTRKEIFRIKFIKMPTTGVDIDDLVKKTNNYSGAEVNAVCHEAAMMALEENLESRFVEMKHFEKALCLVTPRTPSNLINLYENYLSNEI